MREAVVAALEVAGEQLKSNEREVKRYTQIIRRLERVLEILSGKERRGRKPGRKTKRVLKKVHAPISTPPIGKVIPSWNSIFRQLLQDGQNIGRTYTRRELENAALHLRNKAGAKVDNKNATVAVTYSLHTKKLYLDGDKMRWVG